MKVLDLECRQGHVFEGWFASENDFVAQLASDLIDCPTCGNHEISKRLSAPRLNLGAIEPQAAHLPVSAPTDSTFDQFDTRTLIQQLLTEVSTHILQRTENVGDAFPEEARRMHYGEVTSRPIRGHATPAETKDLLDEGVEVFSLLLPEHLRQKNH